MFWQSDSGRYNEVVRCVPLFEDSLWIWWHKCELTELCYTSRPDTTMVLLSVMWCFRMMNNCRYAFKQNKRQSSLTLHSSYIPQISLRSKHCKAYFVFICKRNLSCRLRFPPRLNVWHAILKSKELLNNFTSCKVYSIPVSRSLNADSTLHYCSNEIIKCRVQSWTLIVFSLKKCRKSGFDVSNVSGWLEGHF